MILFLNILIGFIISFLALATIGKILGTLENKKNKQEENLKDNKLSPNKSIKSNYNNFKIKNLLNRTKSMFTAFKKNNKEKKVEDKFSKELSNSINNLEQEMKSFNKSFDKKIAKIMINK